MPSEIKLPDEFFQIFDEETASAAVSDYYYVLNRRQFTFVAFAGSGAASGTIEVSLEPENPTNWFALDTIALNAVKRYEGIFAWIRVTKSATGTPLSIQMLAGLRNVVH
jgi:hypothetical protein